MPDAKPRKPSFLPWLWIPSLYLAEGFPYVVVMNVSTIFLKRFEVSNTELALYTSWLYLPWVIKPFWSPLVDVLRTKRWWIVVMQLLIGAGLAGTAFSFGLPNFLQWTMAFLFLMAFSSATHDIAADGFYMLALDSYEQTWFVGIRSTFYRLAMIAGQGLVVMTAGWLELRLDVKVAWSVVFYGLGTLFVIVAAYHFVTLPKPVDESKGEGITSQLGETMFSFFRKKDIVATLAFLLFYRFSEAQLVKLTSPFLLDSRDAGGLGIGTFEVGFIYGTVGLTLLTVGGILGGLIASQQGLKFWLPWMALSINVPNAVYLVLSLWQPESYVAVCIAVAIEQFGYGFGFTAYMLYMLYISRGEHETAHYAICTGFMALGMMLPGMFSGLVQERLGYQNFFIWILLATIPSFLVAYLVKVDASFGRKQTAN